MFEASKARVMRRGARRAGIYSEINRNIMESKLSAMGGIMCQTMEGSAFVVRRQVAVA